LELAFDERIHVEISGTALTGEHANRTSCCLSVRRAWLAANGRVRKAPKLKERTSSSAPVRSVASRAARRSVSAQCVPAGCPAAPVAARDGVESFVDDGVVAVAATDDISLHRDLLVFHRVG
jgi:hypothetical protein